MKVFCCGIELPLLKGQGMVGYVCPICSDASAGNTKKEAFNNWNKGIKSRLYRVAYYSKSLGNYDVSNSILTRETLLNIKCVAMTCVTHLINCPGLLKAHGYELQEGEIVNVAICKASDFELKTEDADLYLSDNFKLDEKWQIFEVKMKCRWFGTTA